MRVLVTGADGTLGSRVAELLSASGTLVRAHDRKLPETGAAEAVAGDLRDLAHVRELLDGVDAVVHAAAIPNPLDGPDDEIFANNVSATYHVLDSAGRAGVTRVVNVSSTSALGFAWSQLGASPASVPVTEAHPYVGDDVYGLSKQLGEVIAGTASRRWDVPIVSLRFPFLGAGERLKRHLGPIHADPGTDRAGLWAWLDTRDAAGAVLAALTVPLSGHELVNVTAPDTTALEPTAELLRRYHPDVRIGRALGEFETLYANDRGREVLGFTPEHSWRNR